jgi:uncharacterized membrane protein/RimJ/RimL family protein N-acetyltransferase
MSNSPNRPAPPGHHRGPAKIPGESELEREFELERMILFSDAVFAIAITLLVIDIKWPELPESIGGTAMRKLFRPTILQFCAFVASFFYIGRSWAQHLRLFRQLKRYNQRLINLNLLFLFFIITFPFTASGIAGHVRSDFALPLYLYIGNLAIVAWIHYLIGRYIFRINPGLATTGDQDEKRYILIRGKYNALGMASLFITVFIIGMLPQNENYFTWVLPLFAAYIFLFNRITRKFRPRPVSMETERTTLTLLTASDLPAMTAMAHEPDTFRYITKLRVMTDEQYQQFLRLKLEQIRKKTGYHWAVWLKTTGEFIGAVNLNPIGTTNRMQIGCQLKRDYWGQGFASELTSRILEFALHDAKLPEVYGVFEKENRVSRRLLAKLDFKPVETMTENGVGIEIHRYQCT